MNRNKVRTRLTAVAETSTTTLGTWEETAAGGGEGEYKY